MSLLTLRSEICIFLENHLEIFVESSKTDQYWDGAVVIIACTGTNYCPVAMLERYMRLANISSANLSDNYLFRLIISTKNGQLAM